MTDTADSAGAPALPKAPIPTAHDRHFVPYALGTDPYFDRILPFTEVQEGVPWSSGPMPARAYSDDKHDPGGKTGEGIIQREYDLKHRQWGLPTLWVRNMSKDEERTIYFTDYWMPFGPEIAFTAPGLSEEYFDLNVNGGQHRAVETLQEVLDVHVDGQFGSETAVALSRLLTPADVMKAIVAYKDKREAFYRLLGTFRYFGKDWIRRSEEIAQQSEKLERDAEAAKAAK